MALKIAIVGGGIAGLTAAYYLNKKHQIKLFEKSHRLGGNAYAYQSRSGDNLDIAVAAFGKKGYPHFYALLDELNIKTSLCANTYLSLHDLETKDGLYLTPSFKGGLSQGFKLFKLDNFKDIVALFAGIREAYKRLGAGELEGMTLQECLTEISYFKGNTYRVFVCVLCLLSSMDAQEVLSSPASFFF